MNSDTEKDFLANVDYLHNLSMKIRCTKEINTKLLSEITCAKAYINSLLSNLDKDSIDKYELTRISDMFDLILANAEKHRGTRFKNPCSIEVRHVGFNCEEYSIIQFASYTIGIFVMVSFLMLLIALFY